MRFDDSQLGSDQRAAVHRIATAFARGAAHAASVCGAMTRPCINLKW
jgi:hypothetical protein